MRSRESWASAVQGPNTRNEAIDIARKIQADAASSVLAAAVRECVDMERACNINDPARWAVRGCANRIRALAELANPACILPVEEAADGRRGEP